MAEGKGEIERDSEIAMQCMCYGLCNEYEMKNSSLPLNSVTASCDFLDSINIFPFIRKRNNYHFWHCMRSIRKRKWNSYRRRSMANVKAAKISKSYSFSPLRTWFGGSVQCREDISIDKLVVGVYDTLTRSCSIFMVRRSCSFTSYIISRFVSLFSLSLLSGPSQLAVHRTVSDFSTVCRWQRHRNGDICECRCSYTESNDGTKQCERKIKVERWNRFGYIIIQFVFVVRWLRQPRPIACLWPFCRYLLIYSVQLICHWLPRMRETG